MDWNTINGEFVVNRIWKLIPYDFIFWPLQSYFSTSSVFTRTFGMILSILYFDTTQNFPKLTLSLQDSLYSPKMAYFGYIRQKYRENYEKLGETFSNLPKLCKAFLSMSLNISGTLCVSQIFLHTYRIHYRVQKWLILAI